MLSYSVDNKKMTTAFAKWSKEFGDSNKQAVARLAVSMAREQAVLVEPRGKGKKKIVDAIVNEAKRNVVPFKAARDFTKVAKQAKPRAKLGAGWHAITAGQILDSPRKINSFIEKNRSDSTGKVKKLPGSQKGICRQTDLNKVMVQRKKLAGIAKGSVLGAGMEAAKYQRGGKRITIGKNFMAWAQRHAHLGQSARMGTAWNPAIHLISNAKNTLSSRILPGGSIRIAAERAWKATTKWYLYALKQIDR